MTQTVPAAVSAAALAALLSLGLVSGASAQSPVPAEKPITLKLGVFLPSGSALKNAVSDTWFSIGAEYAFVPKAGADAAADTAAGSFVPLAYVDYAGSNRHGINANYIGIGPGFRYNLAAPGSGTLIPYVGAGAGAYFLHAKGFGGSSNKTNFGYRLNAGVEFNQSYLFEINYTDGNSLGGARFGGFNIQAGIKF